MFTNSCITSFARSRKLNSQLDRAIDEAMADLDRRSATNIVARKPSAPATSGTFKLTLPHSSAIPTKAQQQHQPVSGNPEAIAAPSSGPAAATPTSTTATAARLSPNAAKSPRTRTYRQHAVGTVSTLPLRNRPVKIAPAPPSSTVACGTTSTHKLGGRHAK